MADLKSAQLPTANTSCFKEAVCIDAARIFDSCADRDCLEDLRVLFTDRTQPVIDQASTVRCRSVEIINCYIDVEPIPFNHGFYSCDLTFFFKCKFDIYTSPMAPPVTCEGLCVFGKKTILYGSEGNVKVFSSKSSPDELDDQFVPTNTDPTCVVQCVEPVVLDTRLCEERKSCCNPTPCPPRPICRCFDGEFSNAQSNPDKVVLLTLGLFTIVQLQRDVQMLIPAYDYCIPDKECTSASDNPCDVFRQIKFPLDEFFPTSENSKECSNSCRR